MKPLFWLSPWATVEALHVYGTLFGSITFSFASPQCTDAQQCITHFPIWKETSCPFFSCVPSPFLVLCVRVCMLGCASQVLGYLYFTRIVLVLLSAMLPFQVTMVVVGCRRLATTLQQIQQ